MLSFKNLSKLLYVKLKYRKQFHGIVFEKLFSMDFSVQSR